MRRDYVGLAALGFIIFIVTAATIIFFAPSLFASFGSEQGYTFATTQTDMIQVGNGLTVNGKRIYLENLERATTGEGSDDLRNPEKPIARFHVGQQSKPVYADDGRVQLGNWVVTVQDTKPCYRYQSGFGYDSYCTSKIYNIIYGLELNVSKTAIRAEPGKMVVETTGPGRKVLRTNVTVTNGFAPIQTDELSATVFGKEVTLDSGVVGTGTHTYPVRISNSYYDASKFLKRNTTTEDLTLHFENPRLPQSNITGKPDTDGDLRTYESFEPGGSQPSIQDLKEGDAEYSAVDSPCNIQFLRRHGFGTRDCHGYTGGEPTPMSTQNHEFTLTQMQSRSFEFNTTVAYCGENATYQNGRCVIDDTLHLRSDVCPLLQRHQIVTETFSGGQTITADAFQPQPQFFCTKHPVLVTDASGQQTKFTTEPYRKLVNGEAVEIPDDQTYTFYWTVNVNQVETTIICEEGSFNKSSGKCVRTPGVTHRCSQGVYDPQVGSCVVTPETTYICSQGYYDKGLEKCVYEPPTQIQCDKGGYNADRGKCIYQPDVDTECPKGEFDSDAGVCEYKPPVEHVCDRGYYDSSRGVCLAEGTVKKTCPDNATLQNGICKVQPRLVKQTPLQQVRLGLERFIFRNPVTVGGGVVGVLLLAGVAAYLVRR